ncbi:MAG TPA: hypothetical protein VGC09_11125 [Rhodopila sp.]
MEMHHHVGGGRRPPNRPEPNDAWRDDRERLKPSAISVFTEHPLVTLFLVLLFGVLVFGRILP